MPRSASPDYSTLGPSASQVGSPAGANVLQLRDIKAEKQARGSLVHTVQYEGNGGWVQSPAGRVWVSAKHAGAKLLDLSRICFAALLPPDMEKGPYCTGNKNCRHAMPGGYSFVCDFKRALRDDELVSKRPHEQRQPSRSTRGRGSAQQAHYNLQPDHSWWNGRGSGSAKGPWGAKGEWGAKGGWAAKGDWGGKGEWGSKGSWGGKPEWGGKPDQGGKGDWSGKGGWGAKGEWTPKQEWGAKGEWPSGEKGKGKGRGKGESSWNNSW